MQLSKLALLFALVALALAGYKRDNRVRDDPPAPKTWQTEIIRCSTSPESVTACPPEHFCLYDDWRCAVSGYCAFKAGWCMPSVKPDAWAEPPIRKAMRESRDESDESEERD